ncbi:hypothetical protein Sango_1093500 [Sesamum angolense]|uniref:GAG-pre-integrase domain-containing protein n=1 Tax=Sesamum angolense TaxID=2727404 RepID=A0AAE2BW37_9LAMI|nr:hypothetical protein Sango_1093500 [Sesamum angolense]
MAEFSKTATSSSPVENRTVGDSNGKSHNLDYPPLPIISAPLNGNNWLAWSRAVRIALGGRDKLSFIDGTSTQPHEGAEAIKQWKITDYMVLTWILNTISKEIVNAYLYASSARNLWLQLEARYGESNGPLLYQLQREINSMTQEASQLMQFLMGLNETFDGVRSQILVMEPLPHVDKAFSMVMRVERQRKVHMETAETGINNAMYARNGDQERIGYKTFVKKKNVDKRFLTCTCCGKSGHTKESCFKVHGVPDWYKDLIDKKKKGGNEGRVYMAAETEKNPETSANSLIADLMEALKLVQNRSVTDPVKVHFAQFEEELAGTAQLTDSIALAEVLHIPSFQHNLLSVSQLCKALPIRFIFHNSSCILQDQRTEEVLAIGNQIGKLFYLTPSSFSSTAAVNKRTKSVPEFVHLSQDCTSYELWHKRLGHPSENVIDHIPTLRCKQPKEQSVCSICPLAKQSRNLFLRVTLQQIPYLH